MGSKKEVFPDGNELRKKDGSIKGANIDTRMENFFRT